MTPPRPFYSRKKIRLGRLIDVRCELGLVYKACIRRELEWQDARAAVAILVAIATIDQGPGLEARLAQLETLGPRVNGQYAPRLPRARPYHSSTESMQ